MVKIVLLNLITVSRIVLAAAAFLGASPLVLFYVSIWAALSDFVDGYIAKRFNLSTKFGATLDQNADKVFHLVLFTYLYLNSKIHLWFLILFAVREAAIILLRIFNVSSTQSLFAGKTKTALAYTLVIFSIGVLVDGTIMMPETQSLIVYALEILILVAAYYSLILSFNQRVANGS